MDVATFAATALLLVMALYGALLAYGAYRKIAVTAAASEASTEYFKARIRQITEDRQIRRDQAELSWNGARKFVLQRKQPEGGGICSFYLSPHDARPLPPFQPGQFLTFQLDIPGQKKAVIRCYSLSDSPNHPDYYRVSIKAQPAPRDNPENHPPGLVSNFFHDSLNEGDIVDCKAPGGGFYLDMSKQTPVVLIGGGIGLTPVLSMLNAITEAGSKREVWFFYGVRNSSDHVMKEHLQQIARENENVNLHICYSAPGDDDVLGEDYQHKGRVSLDLFKELLPSNNFDYYLCGPPPFMETLVNGLEEWGVPDANVHFEAFGPATVKKVKDAHAATDAPPADAGSAIQVTFSKSGKTLDWTPDAGALLDFAEDNGLDLEYGCRAGNCGSCIVAIKEGDVDYDSPPGAGCEAGSCLACVAIPKGNLVLDA